MAQEHRGWFSGAPGRVSKRQAGLSLVELMVSVAIGLVVVGAVLYVYMSARGAYSTSKSTSRTQEAGRFGLDAILRDVRQTGDIGCGSRLSVALTVLGSPSTPVPVTQAADPPMNMSSVAQSVIGYSVASYAPGSGAPWVVPTAVSPNPPNPAWYAGDVLTLHVGTASPVQMAANPGAGSSASTLYLNNNCAGIAMDNYLVLSTCTAATIVRVSNTPTSPATACPSGGVVSGGVEVDVGAKDGNGNSINTLTGPVTPSSIAGTYQVASLPTVQQFDEVTYYVGQVAGNVRPPALYRYSFTAQQAEEIIDHVENMSVYYGVPNNCVPGNELSYFSAQQVQAAAQWACVTNIRVQLLTAGDELGAVQAPQVIQIGAPGAPQSITAPDTRFRQLFTATAALRERLQ